MHLHAVAPHRHAKQPSELQRLRDRVEELETLLGMNIKLPGVRRQIVRKTIGLLLAREFVTNEMIEIGVYNREGDMPSAHYSYTCAFHARNFLKNHGIELKRVWGEGYYITRADKKKLGALLVAGSDEAH